MTKEEAKKYCDMSVSPFRYYDKNGDEIVAGDTIFLNGRKRIVYLLDDEESLGIDATNPSWIESGRAVSCEYGCYRLLLDDLKECELCGSDRG